MKHLLRPAALVSIVIFLAALPSFARQGGDENAASPANQQSRQQAKPPTALEALYAQLLSPALDTQQVAATENASLAWDALHFKFDNGSIMLTQPVAGHVAAAVFRGKGELTVTPPSAVERESVRRFSGQPVLELGFTQAVFRFAGAAKFKSALNASAEFKPAAVVSVDDDQAMNSILREREGQIRNGGLPTAARVLKSLEGTDPAGDRLLIAELKTDHYGWMEARFDPLELEPVSVHRYAASPLTGDSQFDDVWTSFLDESDLAAGKTAADRHPEELTLSPYVIHVTVPPDLDLQAAADITITPLVAFGRGLLLDLDSNLRITKAAMGGQPLLWVEPADPRRYRNPSYQGDWIYLELPAPVVARQSFVLHLEYAGKFVIQKVGDGNYFCRSFGWYPTSPFGEAMHRADFDLTLAVPKRDTVVATGMKVSDALSGDQRITEWQSETPLTVAGFALGEYKEKEATVAVPGHPVTVQVFANTQPDDLLRYIGIVVNPMDTSNGGHVVAPPGLGNMNAVSRMPYVLDDISTTLRFYTAYFGPFPYSKLSVANIPAGYGQGWPSLLYLSVFSFLDSTQLNSLGASASGLRQLGDMFRAHETAHQWWGHLVTWKTPHDEWLSEGFANGSALLYEQARFGNDRMLQTLEEWRRDLLNHDRSGHAPLQAGPLWLGHRLSSTWDPWGYSIVEYDKGGYVMFMLRNMLYSPGAQQPDQDFIALMQDFTSSYGNSSASTEDFKTTTERHMRAFMDLDGTGRMDWFFDEYVYGVAVPLMDITYTVRDLPSSASSAESDLAVAVHESPGDWKLPLPLYIYRDKTQFARVVLPITGDHVFTIRLPFHPVRIEANRYDDMLAVVRQHVAR